MFWFKPLWKYLEIIQFCNIECSWFLYNNDCNFVFSCIFSWMVQYNLYSLCLMKMVNRVSEIRLIYVPIFRTIFNSFSCCKNAFNIHPDSPLHQYLLNDIICCFLYYFTCNYQLSTSICFYSAPFFLRIYFSTSQ